MDQPEDLKTLLDGWFEVGDQLAHAKAYRALMRALEYVSPEVYTVLGKAELEELRQDVLLRLLDRPSGKLRGKPHPAAYAKRAFRNEQVSVVRKWGPRLARADEVSRHIESVRHRDMNDQVATQLDAARALTIAQSLSSKGRAAVLLTTDPSKLSSSDWHDLVSGLPPPPPARPEHALDAEAASRLVHPPKPEETTRQRYQRVNTFKKTYKRAIEKIRRELESDA